MKEIDCTKCPYAPTGVPLHPPTFEGGATPDAQRTCLLAGITYCRMANEIFIEQMKKEIEQKSWEQIAASKNVKLEAEELLIKELT